MTAGHDTKLYKTTVVTNDYRLIHQLRVRTAALACRTTVNGDGTTQAEFMYIGLTFARLSHDRCKAFARRYVGLYQALDVQCGLLLEQIHAHDGLREPA